MPSPEPVIVNCPSGYQCRLIVEAVWTSSQSVLALAAVLIAVVGVIAIILMTYVHVSGRKS